MPTDGYDAVIVGGGPNGLAAACRLAEAGRRVLVLEARESVGGGTRTEELTLPGFWHDTCSSIHPLGAGSPYFSALPLADHGLDWIHPDIPFAHPLDDGSAVAVHRDLDETVAALGPDGRVYRRTFAPFVDGADRLIPFLTGPPMRIPRHPLLAGRFGLLAFRSAERLGRRFTSRGRALIAGCAAHGFLPLDRPPTGAFAAVLMIGAHAYGWPMPRGGSNHIAASLAGYAASLGAEIRTDAEVRSLDDIPASDVVLFDLTPRQIVRITGDELPARYRRRLSRFKLGPAVFKVDFALSDPVPWAADECRRAGTVHLGGTFEEIAAGEAEVNAGGHPDRPWVIVAQHSLFDPSRAPEGKHTLWTYCHVPNGSTVDMTERIEAQIQRFAPGFRDTVVARHAMGPAQLEARNANLVGGDINGGLQDLRQHFARPVLRPTPYATPHPRFFICSSSTPPGGGVHGMCGFHAAEAVLRRLGAR